MGTASTEKETLSRAASPVERQAAPKTIFVAAAASLVLDVGSNGFCAEETASWWWRCSPRGDDAVDVSISSSSSPSVSLSIIKEVSGETVGASDLEAVNNLLLLRACTVGASVVDGSG